jgi:hypothetical protein
MIRRWDKVEAERGWYDSGAKTCSDLKGTTRLQRAYIIASTPRSGNHNLRRLIALFVAKSVLTPGMSLRRLSSSEPRAPIAHYIPAWVTSQGAAFHPHVHPIGR